MWHRLQSVIRLPMTALTPKVGATHLSPQPQVINKSKRTIHKLLAASVSTVICLSIVGGMDFYLHHRHGINLRGYRGSILGRKQPGEKRVAVLGGSTAWGYGLAAGQDFPAQLQTLLAKEQTTAGPAIKIVNLGFNNEGSYSFTYTLNDYNYLDYDAVLLYSGYNDLGELSNPGRHNVQVFRHRSPVFNWTGYLPLLPTMTVDKWERWRQPRPDQQVVFDPAGSKRAETASELEKRVGQLTAAGPQITAAPAGQCPAEWQFYCDHIYEAVDMALKRDRRVLIVGEPYISDRHIAQQAALEDMLRSRFSGQPGVRYLNLGRTVDLRDKSLCWDGMHLTEEGNRRVAAALTQPILDLLHH